MIRLSTVVGALLNELTIAQVQAQQFAFQLARDFSDDPVLEQLPIKSHSIQGSTVTLRVVVPKVTGGCGAGSNEKRSSRGEGASEDAMYVLTDADDLDCVDPLRVSTIELNLDPQAVHVSSDGDKQVFTLN